MRLVGLSMRNFMPYRGAQRIEFPDDHQRNVMVVFGDNMRGKTALLNAIRWCFYGVAMGRHLRVVPLHLLHNIDAGVAGDWEMEVSIQFEADEHQYDLRRRAAKKRFVARPERPEDFDVEVMLQRDGTAIVADQIEREINRFVPQQVSRFFLFDGELLQEYETLLIEGNDQGRRIKEAIEQVLGVPALIHGRDELGTLLKKAQKRQSVELAQLGGAERLVEQQQKLQVKGEALEEDLRKLRDHLQETRVERSNLDDDLEKSESVYRAKLTLDDCERRRDQICKEQEQLSAEKLHLVSRAWRDLLKPKLRIRREQLSKAQQKYMDKYGTREAIKNEVRHIEEILKMSICPTCSQEVGQDLRKLVGARLEALRRQLQELDQDDRSLTNIVAEISKLDGLISDGVGAQIRDKDRQLGRLDVELTQVENKAEALREEIRGYDTAEIARKRSLRDTLVKNEGKVESEISACMKDADGIKRELAITAKQLDSLPQARAQRSTALVSAYGDLESVFGESVELLRDNLRHSVERRASEAFCSMTTQKAYSGLKINNNYGLTILDENGKAVSVRSAGAEQIVALSLIDGLSRTGRASGPVVMDTPFGRLDTKHRDNILRYLPTITSQLVLLVHDGEIRPETDLAAVAGRIGTRYTIREVGPRHSAIERVYE